MAYKAINNIAAVDLDDINKESATKKYPLGTIVKVNDTSKGAESTFMYVKSHPYQQKQLHLLPLLLPHLHPYGS